MTNLLLPDMKQKIVYQNHLYKGSLVAEMLNEAHFDALAEGWDKASNHFLKLYRDHFETSEAWFHQLNRQIGRLEGVLEFGAGEAQEKGIARLSDEIAKLLNQADVINQRWGLNNPGVLLDITDLMELSSVTREYLGKKRSMQDIMGVLPKIQRALNSANEVLKNELSVKNEAVTRIANRVNEVRPIKKRGNPTWRETRAILYREWEAKVKDNIADDVDRQVLGLLQYSLNQDSNYVKWCWENRYISKK